MKVVRELPEEEWRSFVDKNPRGNIFHTPEIFQVFQRATGYRPELWATINQDGKVLALLLPIQITLGVRLPRFLTTRSVVYGSVLLDPGPHEEEALTFLLSTYIRKADRDILFTELRNQSDLSDLQATLSNSGFVYEDHLNYLIPLNRPIEEIIQSMGRRTRKHIRSGLRRGDVGIEEAVRPDQVERCYEIIKNTYQNAQVPLVDRSLFEAVFDILYPLGMVKFLLASLGGTYIAASVELIHKDIIYGWYGGMSREYSSYNSNELLMWHILQWGAENGYRVYDFGGAGKPGEPYGVRDFKAKFGGELVNFGRNVYVHAPTRLKLSQTGYQLFRRYWSGTNRAAMRSLMKTQ